MVFYFRTPSPFIGSMETTYRENELEYYCEIAWIIKTPRITSLAFRPT
jgi:hypothetical protein